MVGVTIDHAYMVYGVMYDMNRAIFSASVDGQASLHLSCIISGVEMNKYFRFACQRGDLQTVQHYIAKESDDDQCREDWTKEASSQGMTARSHALTAGLLCPLLS